MGEQLWTNNYDLPSDDTLLMSTAERYVPRYSLADYQRWEGRWELIDGVAIAITPSPFGHHERIISRLSRMLGNQFDHCRCGLTHEISHCQRA